MRFENITYGEAIRLQELEVIVKDYLDKNYPKLRAEIFSGSKSKLTLKKIQKIVKFSLDKDISLYSKITDYALEFNRLVQKNKK